MDIRLVIGVGIFVVGMVAIGILGLYFEFLKYDYMIERAKYIWNEDEHYENS